jgi:hypothetical protein
MKLIIKITATAMFVFLQFKSTNASPEIKKSISHLFDSRSSQELNFENGNLKAIVFVAYLNGCPNFKKFNVALKEIFLEFKGAVAFVNFDPSLDAHLKVKDNLKDLDSIGNSFPMLIDPNGKINELFKLRTATEVAVIETKNYDIVYRGAIDDSITYDFVRPKANNRYLFNTLSKISKGEKVEIVSSQVFGCLLKLKNKL